MGLYITFYRKSGIFSFCASGGLELLQQYNYLGGTQTFYHCEINPFKTKSSILIILLSTSRMATDAAKGTLCTYAALNRVYPIDENSLQMQSYTKEAKGSEHFQWVKNRRGLKFTFFPPSIVVRSKLFKL